MLGVELLVSLRGIPESQASPVPEVKDGPNLSARHPISNAAKKGHTAVVAKFLDHGVGVNHKRLFNRSPLALAAGGGHFDTIKMLLSRGASLLSADLDGHRPVTYAAREGQDAVADYLLDQFRRKYPHLYLTAKPDVQIMLRSRHGQPVESWTPLCDAVKSAPVSTIWLLLENWADPKVREPPRKVGNRGRALTPLKLMIGRDDSFEVTQLLCIDVWG